MKMPNVSVPQVTTTARDIVPERTSQEPESPMFGDEDDSSFTDITKKKGVASLQIKPKTTSTKDTYNPLNSYLK